MKILHFALLAPGSPQWGLRNALRSVASEYQEFDWYRYWALDQVREMREAFAVQAATFRPDLTFLQIQTPNLLPGAVLSQIPGFTLSWCGDLRDETPEWAWKVAPHVSLNCFSNLRDVENLRSKGHPAEFLNIGFTTDVFTPDGEPRPETPEIVFLGTNYANRFPCSAQRQKVVAAMRQRYGDRFAVYGGGWGPSDPFLLEPEEAAAYRSCKIALDINHYQTVARFTSDRRFRAMGSGAFVIANWHPGIEEDFEIGKHLVCFRSPDEIPDLVDHYLDHEDERKAIAAAGCAHVHANHSWDARMKEILNFSSKYRKAAA